MKRLIIALAAVLLIVPAHALAAEMMPKPIIGNWCSAGGTRRDGDWYRQAYNPGPTEVCVGDLTVFRDGFGWEDTDCTIISQRKAAAALWIVAARCKDEGNDDPPITEIFKFLKHKSAVREFAVTAQHPTETHK
jgi:hypothetical protein